MMKALQSAAAAAMLAVLLCAAAAGFWQTPEHLAAAQVRGVEARRAFCPVLDRLARWVKGGLLSAACSVELPYKAPGRSGGKGFVRESSDFSNAIARRIDAAADSRIRAVGRSDLAKTLSAAWQLLLERTAETLAAAILLLPLTAALMLDGIWRRKAAAFEEKCPGRIRQSIASAGLLAEGIAAPMLMMQPSGWGLGMSIGAVLAAGLMMRTWLANTERWE